MVRKLNDFDGYFPDRDVTLKGFTSTSLSKKQAIRFAKKEENDPYSVEVLLKIQFTGGLQYFCLNSQEYTAFPYEQEVLI